MLNNSNLIATIMSMFIFMICIFTNNNKINKKINNLEIFSDSDTLTAGQLNQVKNEINKKINNLENFSDSDTLTAGQLNQVKNEINSIYNMDIEAIRNLGTIAKSIISSDSEDGTLTIPSNVIIKGHCKIEGKNNGGTGLMLINKLYISKKDTTGKSIVIGGNGGSIVIQGKDPKKRSLVIVDTGGSIQLNGKNDNDTSLDIQEGKIKIDGKDSDGTSIKSTGCINIYGKSTDGNSLYIDGKTGGKIAIYGKHDGRCIYSDGAIHIANKDNKNRSIHIGDANGGSIYMGGKNDDGESIESKGRIKLFGTDGGRAIYIAKDAGYLYIDGKTNNGYGLEIANGIRIKGKSDGGKAIWNEGGGEIK